MLQKVARDEKKTCSYLVAKIGSADNTSRWSCFQVKDTDDWGLTRKLFRYLRWMLLTRAIILKWGILFESCLSWPGGSECFSNASFWPFITRDGRHLKSYFSSFRVIRPDLRVLCPGNYFKRKLVDILVLTWNTIVFHSDERFDM